MVLSVRPDVVHFHNVMGLGANLIPIAKASGARVLVTLHDYWGLCFKNTVTRNDGALCPCVEECAACLATIPTPDGPLPVRLRRDYVALCLEQADLLLSPSAYLARTYERSGVVRNRVTVLSNGIDCATIPVASKPPATPVQFASLGYLGEHKGVPVLLDAAALLADDPALQGRWRLTIAGDGALQPTVRKDIDAGRFGDAVTHVGRLSRVDALALIGRSHVVVLASSFPENEPVTLLETIASGTAQLASRLGGNVDLVEDGQSGLLFTAGDAVDLAAAMKRFILEPGLAETCARRNAERREMFDEHATIARLAELITEAPPPEPRQEEIVVLCAGDRWAGDSGLMLHHLHLLEDGRRRLRLIWHDWATPETWAAASVLWLCGEAGEASLPVVMRALRAGLPVLAPDLGSNASIGPAVTLYGSMLEAMGWIAALQDAPPLPPEPGAGAQARLLGAVAPRSSFSLMTEAVG